MSNLLVTGDDYARWWDGSDDVNRAVDEMWSEISAAAAEGDANAALTIEMAARRTFRADLRGYRRAQGTMHIAVTGEAVTLPAALSVQADDGSRQMPFWSQMTRDQFDVAVAEYAAQTSTRADRLALLRTVQAAWNGHPEITTADAAMRLVGIDPSGLDVAA